MTSPKVAVLRPTYGKFYKDQESVVKALLDHEDFRLVIEDPPGAVVSGPEVNASVMIAAGVDILEVRLDHTANSAIVYINVREQVLPTFVDKPFVKPEKVSHSGYGRVYGHLGDTFSFQKDGFCQHEDCRNQFLAKFGDKMFCYGHRPPSDRKDQCEEPGCVSIWITKVGGRQLCSYHGSRSGLSSHPGYTRSLCVMRSCTERVVNGTDYCVDHLGASAHPDTRVQRVCNAPSCWVKIGQDQTHCAQHVPVKTVESIPLTTITSGDARANGAAQD